MAERAEVLTSNAEPTVSVADPVLDGLRGERMPSQQFLRYGVFGKWLPGCGGGRRRLAPTHLPNAP
ncbi:hypothetical protein GCM10027521_37820 [Amycolatopsis cihanbeyliensis]